MEVNEEQVVSWEEVEVHLDVVLSKSQLEFDAWCSLVVPEVHFRRGVTFFSLTDYLQSVIARIVIPLEAIPDT